MKKFLSVLLCTLFILSSALITVSAEDEPLLTVNIYYGKADSIDSVNIWYNESDEAYYMFMPGDWDLTSAVPYFSGEISIDGTSLQNGVATDVFATVGEKAMSVNGTEYKLIVAISDNIPTVFIDTESGNLDYIHANKNNKESGKIAIYYNGELYLDTDLKQIKGRGNSTWAMDKKPYNIKFDEKIDLFGMGKAKKWSLIASAIDKSLLRNKISYGLADEFGLEYTSNMTHVDLYINSEYMGNYIITESVEIGKERVNISNLADDNEEANEGIDIEECQALTSGSGAGERHYADIPNNPEDISGGYLLEFDMQNRWIAEVSGFETNRGQCVTVKEPEYASKNEVDYIADYYQEAEDALYSDDGKNSLGKHYSEYYDMTSFAKMFVIQEFCKNADASMSSFYIYKDKGSDKLVASPIWDFDYSLYNAVAKLGVSLWKADYHFTDIVYYDTDSNDTEVDGIYMQMMRHEDFRKAVSEEWTNFKALLTEDKYNEISEMAELLTSSAVMDEYRWNINPTLNADEKAEKYSKYVEDIFSFMRTRTEYMDIECSDKYARIIYDNNGAVGRILDENTYSIGDSATVMGNTLKSITMVSDTEFIGWNTMPDGSGEWYYPGDEIKLESFETTLYAMFENTEYNSDIELDGEFITAKALPVAEDIAKLLGVQADCVNISDMTAKVTIDGNTSEYTIVLLGDYDGDGIVKAGDARHALRISAELEDCDQRQMKACDLNGDGIIKASDARNILRISANLI